MQAPAMGSIVTPAAPLKFDSVRAEATFLPRLGQHTVEVLEHAGLARASIDNLLAAGAAVQSSHKENF